MTTYPTVDVHTWNRIRQTWLNFMTALGLQGDVYIQGNKYQLVLQYGDRIVKQLVPMSAINEDPLEQLHAYAGLMYDSLVADDVMYDSISEVDPEIDAVL